MLDRDHFTSSPDYREIDPPAIASLEERLDVNRHIEENDTESLVFAVASIKKIATREELKSDGGGTGRSDTNDNKE